MDTTVTDQLLLDFSNWVKSTQGFIEREIPPTLHELVVAIAIQNAIIVFSCVLLLMVGLYFTYKSRKQWNLHLIKPSKGYYSSFWSGDEYTEWQVYGMIGIIIIFGSSIAILAEGLPALTTLVKCVFSPRIVIIEYFTHLIK